jgi:hypothetical protein
VRNDLIWWIPFALYLHDAWPFYKRDMLHSDLGVHSSSSEFKL